jgi:predicted HTH domain antitoxin
LISLFAAHIGRRDAILPSIEPDPLEKHLLLLLYAKDASEREFSPIKGQLWLQKEMFLVAREVPDLKEEFEEFRLGPFSESIDDLSDRLTVSGFIEQGKQGIGLTSKGRELARDLWVRSDPKERGLVERVKKFANDLTGDELLVFVYVRFPEYTGLSDIKDDIEVKRPDAAVGLFRKGKVSLTAAAEISGRSLLEFREMIRSRGMAIAEFSKEETREELLGVSPSRNA